MLAEKALQENIPEKSASLISWKKIDYLLICLLIWSSGNFPFQKIIINAQITTLCILALVSLIFIFHHYDPIDTNKTYLYFGFLFISLIHTLGSGSLFSELGNCVRVTNAFLIALILGKNFIPYLIKTIVAASIWCLILWVLYISNLLGFLTPFLQRLSTLYDLPSGYCILYTFNQSSYRNAGIFWEPGVYAAYLNMVIILLYSTKELYTAKEIKYYLLILIISLLSTMSTTGYMVLFIFATGMIVSSKRTNPVVKFFLILAAIYLCLHLYNNLSFLGEKIEKQYYSSIDEAYGWRITRFGTLINDWYFIRQKPFFGWGYNYDYIDIDLLELKSRMGNGFSDYILKNGFIGFLLWFIPSCAFFTKLKNRYFAFFTMLCLIIMLQGESLLNLTFFLTLPFLVVESSNTQEISPSIIP